MVLYQVQEKFTKELLNSLEKKCWMKGSLSVLQNLKKAKERYLFVFKIVYFYLVLNSCRLYYIENLLIDFHLIANTIC